MLKFLVLSRSYDLESFWHFFIFAVIEVLADISFTDVGFMKFSVFRFCGNRDVMVDIDTLLLYLCVVWTQSSFMFDGLCLSLSLCFAFFADEV